jgi:DNA-binding PadR family transcriptional regulator
MRDILSRLLRAGRGLPRLSATEALILRLLVYEGPSYGLALVAASDGRLKRGTVYVTLGRMIDKGWVRIQGAAAAPEGGMKRPLYRPPAAGPRLLRAWETAARALVAAEARS